MKRPKMPKVCDTCSEGEELHWSEEEEMWICNECEEASYEKRSVDDMWLQEAHQYIGEEGNYE